MNYLYSQDYLGEGTEGIAVGNFIENVPCIATFNRNVLKLWRLANGIMLLKEKFLFERILYLDKYSLDDNKHGLIILFDVAKIVMAEYNQENNDFDIISLKCFEKDQFDIRDDDNKVLRLKDQIGMLQVSKYYFSLFPMKQNYFTAKAFKFSDVSEKIRNPIDFVFLDNYSVPTVCIVYLPDPKRYTAGTSTSVLIFSIDVLMGTFYVVDEFIAPPQTFKVLSSGHNILLLSPNVILLRSLNSMYSLPLNRMADGYFSEPTRKEVVLDAAQCLFVDDLCLVFNGNGEIYRLNIKNDIKRIIDATLIYEGMDSPFCSINHCGDLVVLGSAKASAGIFRLQFDSGVEEDELAAEEDLTYQHFFHSGRRIFRLFEEEKHGENADNTPTRHESGILYKLGAKQREDSNHTSIKHGKGASILDRNKIPFIQARDDDILPTSHGVEVLDSISQPDEADVEIKEVVEDQELCSTISQNKVGLANTNSNDDLTVVSESCLKRISPESEGGEDSNTKRLKRTDKETPAQTSINTEELGGTGIFNATHTTDNLIGQTSTVTNKGEDDSKQGSQSDIQETQKDRNCKGKPKGVTADVGSKMKQRVFLAKIAELPHIGQINEMKKNSIGGYVAVAEGHGSGFLSMNKNFRIIPEKSVKMKGYKQFFKIGDYYLITNENESILIRWIDEIEDITSDIERSGKTILFCRIEGKYYQITTTKILVLNSEFVKIHEQRFINAIKDAKVAENLKMLILLFEDNSLHLYDENITQIHNFSGIISFSVCLNFLIICKYRRFFIYNLLDHRLEFISENIFDMPPVLEFVSTKTYMRLSTVSTNPSDPSQTVYAAHSPKNQNAVKNSDLTVLTYKNTKRQDNRGDSINPDLSTTIIESFASEAASFEDGEDVAEHIVLLTKNKTVILIRTNSGLLRMYEAHYPLDKLIKTCNSNHKQGFFYSKAIQPLICFEKNQLENSFSAANHFVYIKAKVSYFFVASDHGTFIHKSQYILDCVGSAEDRLLCLFKGTLSLSKPLHGQNSTTSCPEVPCLFKGTQSLSKPLHDQTSTAASPGVPHNLDSVHPTTVDSAATKTEPEDHKTETIEDIEKQSTTSLPAIDEITFDSFVGNGEDNKHPTKAVCKRGDKPVNGQIVSMAPRTMYEQKYITQEHKAGRILKSIEVCDGYYVVGSCIEAPFSLDDDNIDGLPVTTYHFSLDLYTKDFEMISTVAMDKNEFIFDIKYLNLNDVQGVNGKSKFLTVCTTFIEGEDKQARGRLHILEIISIVPDETNPKKDRKLKHLGVEKIKGSIVQCEEIRGNIAMCLGTKIMIYRVDRAEGIIPIGFHDMHMFTTSIAVIKNYILVSDVYRGISFFFYQSKPVRLHLLGTGDLIHKASAVGLITAGKELSMVCSDGTGSIHIYTYSPNNILSQDGTKLVKRAEIKTGLGRLILNKIERSSRIVEFTSQTNMIVKIKGIEDKDYYKLLSIQTAIGKYITNTFGFSIRGYLERSVHIHSISTKVPIIYNVLMEFVIFPCNLQQTISKELQISRSDIIELIYSLQY